MNFTLEDLENLSKLARVSVGENEKEKMLADIQAILGYIGEINSVSADLVQEKPFLYNVVREDIITRGAGVNTEIFLSSAPKRDGEYVEVAQVLKD